MARWTKGLWLGLGLIGAACAPAEGGGATTELHANALTAGDPGDLDILFMIDNSSSMTPMQAKMLAQDPGFMKILEQFPNGLPNIHVGVVSSDMGAPGDSTSSIGCLPAGDNGVFQATPRGTCTSTTLAPGATFISNVHGNTNYTGKLEDVFSCIADLGTSGCGFEHQLASVARALGADGAPPPSDNLGFLRPNAELAIVLLTNEDDCSAPANTTLYSLNGGTQSITNPLGPIWNYRCNQFGHLCTDPTSATPNALISPPLNPPGDATAGPPPTLTLTNCESNETSSSMLTSVASFVAGIRALKANPDDQIVVGAISPPVTPYAVEWVPPASPPPGTTGELWPQVQHSCGAQGGDDVNPNAAMFTTDGSFGDPGVRVAQWVHAFGANGVVRSVCDADYTASFQAIADKIQQHLQPSSDTGVGGAGGAGTAGTSGTGAAGSNGAGGAGGAAGSHGAAGSSGSAGSNGTGGAAGAGTAGASGMAGHAGGGAGGAVSMTGTGGVAGSGPGGAAGHVSASGGAGGAIAATGGATGQAGATGTGGAAGASAGGTIGSAGAPGTGGAPGSGGTPGTGGNTATGGTHGTGGASGSAGSGPTTGGGKSGCSCDTAPGSTGAPALVLLAMALGFTARRRPRSPFTRPTSRRRPC